MIKVEENSLSHYGLRGRLYEGKVSPPVVYLQVFMGCNLPHKILFNGGLNPKITRYNKLNTYVLIHAKLNVRCGKGPVQLQQDLKKEPLRFGTFSFNVPLSLDFFYLFQGFSSFLTVVMARLSHLAERLNNLTLIS